MRGERKRTAAALPAGRAVGDEGHLEEALGVHVLHHVPRVRIEGHGAGAVAPDFAIERREPLDEVGGALHLSDALARVTERPPLRHLGGEGDGGEEERQRRLRDDARGQPRL